MSPPFRGGTERLHRGWSMGIVRFLLILGIVLWIVRIAWRFFQSENEQTRNDRSPQGASKFDNLSRCRRCGILIPQDSVLMQEDRPYCSPQCRDGQASG